MTHNIYQHEAANLVICRLIKERDEEFKKSNYNFGTQNRVAFLDMLLKAKNDDPTITYNDIQEEVDTFMFEGIILHLF